MFSVLKLYIYKAATLYAIGKFVYISVQLIVFNICFKASFNPWKLFGKFYNISMMVGR